MIVGIVVGAFVAATGIVLIVARRRVAENFRELPSWAKSTPRTVVFFGAALIAIGGFCVVLSAAAMR